MVMYMATMPIQMTTDILFAVVLSDFYRRFSCSLWSFLNLLVVSFLNGATLYAKQPNEQCF